MTRLAWITPGYPPERGGVSDHSLAMVSALRDHGNDVVVCSRPQDRGFARLAAELSVHKPQAVVVAYTPLGYAPRTGGIAPAFVHWCKRLRMNTGASTLLFAHEASLPARYHWRRRELKLALLGAGQVAQFEILARTFDKVVFSNERTRQEWSVRLPGLENRLGTVRICSNIPMIRTENPAADLARAGYAVAEKVILFFGSGHPSVLFDYVEAAMRRLLRTDPNVRLVIVGMDAARLQRSSPSLAQLGTCVQALGYVPAREVSLWLQVAQLVVAPLIEGVNARKGTVMAALQHGCAVATTRGSHTCNDVRWSEICALSPVDREAFAASAVACFEDYDRRERLGRAAKSEYEAHASASVTASKLLSVLGR